MPTLATLATEAHEAHEANKANEANEANEAYNHQLIFSRRSKCPRFDPGLWQFCCCKLTIDRISAENRHHRDSNSGSPVYYRVIKEDCEL